MFDSLRRNKQKEKQVDAVTKFASEARAISKLSANSGSSMLQAFRGDSEERNDNPYGDLAGASNIALGGKNTVP